MYIPNTTKPYRQRKLLKVIKLITNNRVTDDSLLSFCLSIYY